MNVGVVAALTAEARLLGPTSQRDDGLLMTQSGALVAVSGMGAAAAAVAADTLADAGAMGLLSWGFAGGLDPTLCAGTICLPTAILAGDGTTLATHASWRERVQSALAGAWVACGTLLTHESVVAETAAKARFFRATGALAVDMESVAVARVACQRTLPFIAVRAIVDTAGDGLPQSVLTSGNSGQIRIGQLLRGLVGSPADIVPLMRLAARYHAARTALRRVAGLDVLTRLADVDSLTVDT